VPAGAQSISGTLAAQLTLTRACAISGVSGTSGLDFGTLEAHCFAFCSNRFAAASAAA
jgi:hypothetical protein